VKLEFSRQIFEKYSNIKFPIKIRPVEAKLFHADGQTDMTKLIVACRSVANAPKRFLFFDWASSFVSYIKGLFSVNFEIGEI
jgi:hypothetical protein